jgi:hypothetical protein
MKENVFLINLHGIGDCIVTVFHEKGDELGAGGDVEFSEYPADMGFYGLFAEKQL